MARPPGQPKHLPRALGVFLLIGAILLPGAPGGASSAKTELVSVDSAGAEGNGTSYRPSISADGRFVAFPSFASNLVPNDTNDRYDVFVYDRKLGTTERASLGPDGSEGDGHSQAPAISADGRFVAFESSASNLVEGGIAEDDVYVRDRKLGTTRRVSVSSAGSPGDGTSLNPAISADGRFVAFESAASNLVPNDTNQAVDVFVRDRKLGTTRRVSTSSDGSQADGAVGFTADIPPSISADGRYVAFSSGAFNLVKKDTNGTYDVFVRDMRRGTTQRVSLSSDEAEGNGASVYPSISADGRLVAFSSSASNLVPNDTNGASDVFVLHRRLRTTSRVSLSSNGAEGNGASDFPSISAAGRYVAFSSGAFNLVKNDTNGTYDVFVCDMKRGTTQPVSLSSDEAEGNGHSLRPSLSARGRFVAFYSGASNLVPNDTNGAADVFVLGPLVRELAVRE